MTPGEVLYSFYHADDSCLTDAGPFGRGSLYSQPLARQPSSVSPSRLNSSPRVFIQHHQQLARAWRAVRLCRPHLSSPLPPACRKTAAPRSGIISSDDVSTPTRRPPRLLNTSPSRPLRLDTAPDERLRRPPTAHTRLALPRGPPILRKLDRYRAYPPCFCPKGHCSSVLGPAARIAQAVSLFAPHQS